MSSKFLNNIDLNQNELQNATIHKLASAPGTPVAGQMYYNTTSNTLQAYNGTVWITIGRLDQISAPTASVSMNSQVVTNVANAVANTDAMNKQSTLALKVTDLTAPTSALNMNNQKITSLPTPTLGTDAVNKDYVDNLSMGISGKNSVRLATTAAINVVTGTLLTIDGVVTVAGDRVLVKNQTLPAENGIYIAGAGGWARSGDMNMASEFAGAFTFIQEGSTLSDTGWLCTVNNTVVLGTTAIAWIQFSSAGQVTASNLGTGASIFSAKVGNDLQFKSIIGTGALTVTANANDLTLTVNTATLVSSGFTKKVTFDSTGTTGNITVTHNLGNQYPHITIIETTTTPKNKINADITYTDVNSFIATIPGTYVAGQYKFVVIG